MALISCPQCGKQVSDRAKECPHCGLAKPGAIPAEQPGDAEPRDLDTVLRELTRVNSQLSDPAISDPDVRIRLRKARQRLRAESAQLRPPVEPQQPRAGPARAPARPESAPTDRAHGLIKFWWIMLPVMVVGPALWATISGSFSDNDFSTAWGPASYEDMAAVGFAILGFVAWLGLTLYFVPTLVAFGRGAQARGAALAVNVLFGWTVIGWVIALVIAAGPKGAPRSGSGTTGAKKSAPVTIGVAVGQAATVEPVAGTPSWVDYRRAQSARHLPSGTLVMVIGKTADMVMVKTAEKERLWVALGSLKRQAAPQAPSG